MSKNRKIIFNLSLIVAFLLIQIIILKTVAVKTYNPFGDYPPQVVLNRIDLDGSGPDSQLRDLINTYDLSEKPALTLDDKVHVRAIKCMDSDSSVDIKGHVYWELMGPTRVPQIKIGEGVAKRSPGCESFDYQNPIPPEAAKVTQELFDKGIQAVTWRITGVETPITNKKTVSKVWTTENFMIINLP